MTHQTGCLTELLFQDSATGVVILDREGWVERGNETVARMAALPLSQIEGWPAFMLVARPFRAGFKAMLDDAAAGSGHPAFNSRLQGTGLGVDVEAHAIAGIDGLCGGYLVRVREQRSEQLQVSRLGDSQKLQALGQLTAGVAHDFNNLIGAMLGAAETLEEGAVSRDDLHGREVLAELRDGALRGRALVGRLLGFGRPTDLATQELAVDAAIADLGDMLRRLFPPAIRLTLDLQVAECRVHADPTRFDQVLVNLAINARDAMPDGGTLVIRSRARLLEHGFDGALGHVPAGSYIVTEVSDTGCGIDPAILPRIFSPFFTTRIEQGGNGLGLSTVREIVGEFGGFIDLRSEMGRGTRIRVYLPQVVARSDSPPARLAAYRAVPAEAPVGRGTVLLVEDETALCNLAEGALRRAGWRVLQAESGEAALALIGKMATGVGRPSVLVTDISLPDMNGWALAHTIRTRLDAPDLPVVLTSGSITRSLAVEMARLGNAAAFLAKPYSLAELTSMLEPLAHGPGRINISAALVNSTLDEHMTNKQAGPRLHSVAWKGLNMTDSAGGA